MNRNPAAKRLPIARSAAARIESPRAGTAHLIDDVDGERIVFALLEDDLPRLAPLLEEFTVQTGVTVVPDPQPFDALFTKVSISITQGTRSYDVVSISETWVPQFAAGDFLSSLDDLVEDSIGTPFISSQLALGRSNEDDDLRALPWRANVQVFVERHDLLAAAGAPSPGSWLDVKRVAKTIAPHLPGGMYPYGMRARTSLDAAFSNLPLLRGLGSEVVDPATGTSFLASTESMMAVNLMTDLAALVPPGVDEIGSEELVELVVTGRVVMSAELWADQLFGLLGEGAATASMLRARAQPVRRWIAPAGVTDTWMLALPDSGEHGEAAAQLISWLTAPEQQVRLLLDANVLPTRSELYRDTHVLAQFPFLTEVLNALVRARPRPRTPLYPAVEEIHGRYVREVLLGAMEGPVAMRRAHLEIHELMLREGVIED